MYALFKDGQRLSRLTYLTKRIAKTTAYMLGYLDKNHKLKEGYTIEEIKD